MTTEPTPQEQPEKLEAAEQNAAEKKARKTLKISVIVNIVLVVIIAIAGVSGVLLHQSDTNPNFCATCHIMQPNVTSYLTSNNLDHIHMEAGVQCKECHSDYDVVAEITSGFKFITGNYEVDATGNLTQRKFSDTVCTQCHISLDHVAEKTSDLTRNPHDSHLGDLPCNTCHVAHGEQIDYCAQCHDNGGQTMFGADEPAE